MNEHYCIELRISEEDISSNIEREKEHGHGFLHKHHHHDHPTYLDSDKWTAGEETHPGLVTRSQIVPIRNIDGVANKQSEIASIHDDVLSNSIYGNRRASTTEERRNPFAIREGNSFAWQNVNMVVVCITCNRDLLFYVCHCSNTRCLAKE